MYRHDLRLVLRFGVQGEFAELVRQLHEEETARGWTPPRVWHAVSGHVNGVVLQHDYRDDETYRRERTAFHENPGSVGDVLARLGELAVPGTAVQSELVAVTFPPAGRSPAGPR